jgi:tripartite-type tricarboxylate transporter receptor subunit TctC
MMDNGEVRAPMDADSIRPARSRRGRALSIVLVAALVVGASASHAQSYPSRPIRIIVPFSPGGAVDGPTRLIAEELSKHLGQGVIVDNKPGAGATIGAELVARAAPDGYTLLLASQTNAISASLYPKLAFDPVEDFAPVSLIGREPGVLVVNPALPASTMQEFIAYVRARPGQVDYASSGNGSGQHLFAALLASMTGVTMNHIPYRGSSQATTDLLSGRVQMSIPGMAGMLVHIRSGKLRALAVTSARRAPQLPDVPTVAEAGVPGYEAYVWMGLLAPKSTPAAIIDKLQRELLVVLASDEVKRYMANASIEVVGSSPSEFGAFFHSEKDRWAKIVRETGAKVD